MTNHSQDVSKRQFRQQFTVSPLKQTSLRSAFMEEQSHTLFKDKHNRS